MAAAYRIQYQQMDELSTQLQNTNVSDLRIPEIKEKSLKTDGLAE